MVADGAVVADDGSGTSHDDPFECVQGRCAHGVGVLRARL